MAEKEKQESVENLKQELLETKAKLADNIAIPEPKKKAYSRIDISELEKAGHIIGKPDQKLSEGHDPEDLQKWDMWLCALELKDIGRLPETGEAWSVPHEITPMKIENAGKSGNDKSFQWENNAVNFRERGANKQILYNFPANTVEAGKKYPCHYFVVKEGRGADVKTHVRLVIKDFPKVTNAPADSSKWGRG